MTHSMDIENESMALDAIAALKQAIFICDDTATLSLTLIAGESEWLTKVLPESELHQTFVLSEHSYFLQDFLIDAKDIWQSSSNSKLSSGLWTEAFDSQNKLHIHLEAIAIKENEHNYLILINQSEEFLEKQSTLQAAREMVLANDKLQEQYDYLQNRIVHVLEKPSTPNELLPPILSAIENANFGVMIVNRHFTPLIDNPAILKIFNNLEHSTEYSHSLIDLVLDLMKTQVPEYERIISMGSRWVGELCWMSLPNTLKWLKVAIYPAKNSANEIEHWIFFINDISREKHLLQRNETLTHYDLLTNLPNRYAFWQCLDKSIAKAEPFLLLYIDIKNFKQVNEFYGHVEGDKLLVEFSLRCRALLKPDDYIARVGGDEFAIVYHHIQTPDAAKKLNKELQSIIRMPFYIESGDTFSIDISTGGTFFPYDSILPEELMRFADFSAYNNVNIREGINYYSTEMNEDSRKRIWFENGLRKAIGNNEFSLVFQPILNLKTQKIEKVEALIRWYKPDYGLVMPTDFIAIAEQSGFIIDLGKWVFNKAVSYLKELELRNCAVKISINLSPLQVQDNSLLSFIKSCVEISNVDPSYIEVEITEGSLVTDFDEMYDLLTLLRNLGLSVAIDDFGTGYSSLAYLKKLPIDSLKIDRSFVQDIVTDNNDKAIVMAIIAMAHQLRLSVVAEGVETPEQQLFLTDNNCDSAQGYLFSKPLCFDDLLTYLTQ